MIDIVDFEYKGSLLGFSHIYRYNDFKIVLGGDETQNRQTVEKKKVDILMSPERNL